MIKIVYNKLLRGWFVVRGAHQTPLTGRFETKAQAQAWLNRDCDPGFVDLDRMYEDQCAEICGLNREER